MMNLRATACDQRATPSNAAGANGLPAREPRNPVRRHVRQATTVRGMSPSMMVSTSKS